MSYATLKKRCKELGIEKWPSSHERWRNLPGAGQDAGLAIFPHQSDLQASGQALSYAQQHGYFRPAANCIPQFGLLGATGCSPGLRPLAGLASLLQMSPSAQAGTSQMPSSGCPIDKFLESNPPNMEIRMTVEEFGKVAKSLGEFVKNSVEREFQKQREAEEKEKEKEKSTTEGGWGVRQPAHRRAIPPQGVPQLQVHRKGRPRRPQNGGDLPSAATGARTDPGLAGGAGGNAGQPVKAPKGLPALFLSFLF